MLEKQFIQFSATHPSKRGHEFPVPVDYNEGMQLFIPSGNFEYCHICNSDGTIISTMSIDDLEAGADSGTFAVLSLFCGDFDSIAAKKMAIGEHFRIAISTGDSGFGSIVYRYSNVMYLSDGEGLSRLSYKCDNDEFGFPFKTCYGFSAYVSLPIKLSAPQFTQNDKRYTKLSGEQVVLFASVTKEYEGETDYIPEEWHEKIVTALSCDNVLINGVKYNKSDTYKIDWDNYTTCDDSDIKIARATFKMKANVASRNSN